MSITEAGLPPWKKPKQPKNIAMQAFPEQFARPTSQAPKPRRRWWNQSPKKQKSDRLYMAIQREFLAKPENSFCRVHYALTGEKIQAVCVHHIRGRLGTLKFDTRFFCPVASKNSLWPHANVEEARKLGLIAKVGEWNEAPDDDETRRLRAWMVEKGL